MPKILGIYIHIPFCRSKCDYCDFYSLPGTEEQMQVYHKALLARIREAAPQLRGYQIDSIYFGGGTPSYYGERRLRELLLALRRALTVTRGAEITLEANPDSVEQKSFARLQRAGFNRVSLGMQSANPCELADLHRVHDFSQVEQAVAALRAAKFDNISLDLIYGLPNQSMESWQQSLSAALALAPEHLSAYGLKVEEGTPLCTRVELGELLPDDDLQADMYLYLCKQLRRAGYRQYEISNFSKTGRESRHNLKYWMGRDYLGFGPAAHSCVAGKRLACARELDNFQDLRVPLADLYELCETLNPTERAREYLLLRLRTLRGIEEWEYRREFTRNFEPLQHKLELFESRGLAIQSGHRWHLTPEGFLLSNSIIGALLEAQEEAQEEEETLPSSPRDLRPPQPSPLQASPKGRFALRLPRLRRAAVATPDAEQQTEYHSPEGGRPDAQPAKEDATHV